MATSWVVNAFVDATPISGPACVYKTSLDSLAILLSITLHIDITLAPFLFASFTAARVSAVSPDWDMAITSVFLSARGFLYLNSEPRSTSVGILQNSSMRNLPIRAACHDVPQAMMYILFIPFISVSVIEMPSSRTLPVSSDILPLNVSVTALACSNISFSMKWR